MMPLRMLKPGKKFPEWVGIDCPQGVESGCYGLIFKRNGAMHVWIIAGSFISVPYGVKGSFLISQSPILYGGWKGFFRWGRALISNSVEPEQEKKDE